jgi:hypothetical protein
MFGRTIILPPAYNLARAHQERAKAEACTCPIDRIGHLRLAAIFESRADEYRLLELEADLIEG